MKLPLKYSQYKTKHMFSSKIQVGKDSYIDMPIGMRLLFSFLFAISLLVSNYIISLFQLPSLAEAFLIGVVLIIAIKPLTYLIYRLVFWLEVQRYEKHD